MTDKFKKLEKVVVNIGVGRQRGLAQFEEKILPEIAKEAALIVGQKLAPRKAKQSIAGFKIRAGDVVGLQATLRGNRMKGFITKLIKIVIPRVKDFRGIDQKNVDQNGNLNIGFRDQFVFPEIEPEKSNVSFGLQVTFVPGQQGKRAEAIELYRALGVPFKK
jgi:large subunit ribosomal protein L5